MAGSSSCNTTTSAFSRLIKSEHGFGTPVLHENVEAQHASAPPYSGFSFLAAGFRFGPRGPAAHRFPL